MKRSRPERASRLLVALLPAFPGSSASCYRTGPARPRARARGPRIWSVPFCLPCLPCAAAAGSLPAAAAPPPSFLPAPDPIPAAACVAALRHLVASFFKLRRLPASSSTCLQLLLPLFLSRTCPLPRSLALSPRPAGIALLLLLLLLLFPSRARARALALGLRKLSLHAPTGREAGRQGLGATASGFQYCD